MKKIKRGDGVDRDGWGSEGSGQAGAYEDHGRTF